MEDNRSYMKITEDKGQMNGRWLSFIERPLSSIFICLLLSSSFSLLSCSVEDTTEDEYANWQERNEGTTDRWAIQANNGNYQKLLTYTKNESAPGLKNSDYIYYEVLERGNGTESPIYTDTVRVAYRGRLIPTTSYSEGYVFDQTYLNDFNWKTANMVDFSISGGLVNGFATALMNMHAGDRWRVYIPYQLGYGSSTQSGIRAYSNLTFEIALKTFWHPGEQMGQFKSR